MKKKKWLLSADHNACAEAMAGELGLSRLTARVLAARGCDTPEKARDFMTQSVNGIHDPLHIGGIIIAGIPARTRTGIRNAVGHALFVTLAGGMRVPAWKLQGFTHQMQRRRLGVTAENLSVNAVKKGFSIRILWMFIT